MAECIFCSIVNKTAPAEIIFEDERVVVIRDRKPITPVHLLIIPRKHIASLNDITPEDNGLTSHILFIAMEVAKLAGISESGYRTVINTGREAGQTVYHLHIHVLGGMPMSFAMQTWGLG